MDAISNYEKMKNAMAESFLHYDQGEMIRKFSLQADPNYLYMTFVNRPYRIDRQNGCVQWLDVSLEAPHEADYNEAMTIYDVLCNARDNAHLAGDFVNINRKTAAFFREQQIPFKARPRNSRAPVKHSPG